MLFDLRPARVDVPAVELKPRQERIVAAAPRSRGEDAGETVIDQILEFIAPLYGIIAVAVVVVPVVDDEVLRDGVNILLPLRFDEHVVPDAGADAEFPYRTGNGVKMLGVEFHRVALRADGALAEIVAFVSAEMEIIHFPAAEKVDVFGDQFFQKLARAALRDAVAVGGRIYFPQMAVFFEPENVFGVSESLQKRNVFEPQRFRFGEDLPELILRKSFAVRRFRTRVKADLVFDLPEDMRVSGRGDLFEQLRDEPAAHLDRVEVHVENKIRRAGRADGGESGNYRKSLHFCRFHFAAGLFLPARV